MKKWLGFFGLAVLLLGVFAEVSHGMRVKGTSKGSANDQFLFVTRFCFSTNPDGPQGPFDQQGTLEWQAWSPQAHSPLQSVRVLMYNDFDQGSGDYNMSSSWNNVWNNKKLSCDDKVARADQYDAPVLLLAPPPGKATLYLGQKERPHNWYFATSKCNATGPFEVSYDLHFYNPSASAWNREFSCEQQGLLTIYVVFFVLYFVLLALQTWSAWRLAREFTFHPMAKLLTAGLSAMFIAHFSWVIHYGVYANNGVGSPAMKYIGEVFYFLSFMSFLLLLILVAHGWCITRVSLSDLKHRNAIFIFVLCLCVAFLVVFIVQLVNTHPEKSIWIYATPSGIVLDVLMLITMIYVIAVMYFTRQEEGSDEKRRLYFYAFFIAVFWLGITPFMTAVSAGLHSWNYIKIVMAVVEPVYFLCYLGMVILMLPFNALKYFQTKTVDSFESSSGHYDAL